MSKKGSSSKATTKSTRAAQSTKISKSGGSAQMVKDSASTTGTGPSNKGKSK